MPTPTNRLCVRLRAENLEPRILLAADAIDGLEPQSPLDLSNVEFRSIDGSGNNLVDDAQGAADTRVIRFGYPAVYPDGHGDVVDVEGRPNARDISNAIHAQSDSVVNDRHLTDWIFQWGQFLTHDMDLTINGSLYNELSTGEVGDFSIAINDPNDPLGPNPMPFNRTEFDPTTGTPDLIDTGFGPRANWREQINRVTSYIDASNVYGSDAERAAALRTFEGGKLITSADGLLPGLNDVGLDNDDPFRAGAELFLAGDVRANETVALTAVHALFVREHNRLADRIAELYPQLNDEEIYQLARRIVGAEMQAITYNEFLPALLGYDSAPRAEDAVYDAELNASITNSFAAAIFRFGHSMINEDLLLVDNAGHTVDRLSLDEAFFDPDFLKDNPQAVDLLMKGLSEQLGQENDLLLVDGVRNNLFGPPGAGGVDLAALDIERGRDHGLPDYNALRAFYGLERVTSFAEINSDPAIQQQLEALYGDIDNIDAFVGALAEDHLSGSSVGPLVDAVLVNQFTRLRDGDRFFYTNDPELASRDAKRIVDLEQVTLAKIIQWNTGVTDLQDNVFFDPSVLVYEVPAAHRSAETYVVASSGQVSIARGDSNRAVDVASLDDISQVIIVGSPTRNDTIRVAVAAAQGGLEDGVIVYGRGGLDTLIVDGSTRRDTIVVDAPQVDINGTVVQFSTIDELVVSPGRERDRVSIVDEGDTDVTVRDGDGKRRDRDGGRSGSRSRGDRDAAPLMEELDGARRRRR
ncbi:MAG: LEPR-XLL domain-containing protein [Planctomycetota bacterium]|nr:MAG: LEPR-XLL domain-containing protein [Planctomycetota bacterium]